MMSASEGGGGLGKAAIVREVERILEYESVPNADKVEGGGQNKANFFADILNGSPRSRPRSRSMWLFVRSRAGSAAGRIDAVARIGKLNSISKPKMRLIVCIRLRAPSCASLRA